MIIYVALEHLVIHIFNGKNIFIRNLFFRIYADFEADNGIENSTTGKTTTNIYKQNPALNGYHIES